MQPQSNSDAVLRRTYRFRLYPSRRQAQFLNDQINEACSLYNAALQERRDAWKLAHHSVRFYDQSSQLKDIRAAGNLTLVNFDTAEDVLHRVDKTFAAFFVRVKRGERAGYPRFRPRQRYDSITFPHYGNGCRLLESGRLRIQGAGEIKVKLHRSCEGQIKTVTLKRESGRWFVHFSVKCAPHPLVCRTEAVGIDVGLTSFATLSDGTQIANPRFFRAAQAKLRIAQRRLARRKKGSHGRRKALRILQGASRHVAHQRADFQHKTARTLVSRYGLIAVEDLNMKGLAGGMLAKSVHDAGWSMFLRRIEDKAESAGRTFVRVDPSGTTQNCSRCGVHVPKTLKHRWHSCPSCGLNLSRDENAARNILLRALGPGSGLWTSTWGSGPCVVQEAASFKAGQSDHTTERPSEERRYAVGE